VEIIKSQDGNVLQEIRIYVTSNFATFVCPKCDIGRTADVSKVLGAKAEVKIKCKCKCGYTFKAILERRKFFRKNIELDGMFITQEQAQQFLIKIVDVSRSGCKIKLNADSNSFSVGERISLEFKLDDSTHSLVRKDAVIRSNTGSLLGVEFDTIDEYDKLGHYLMFN